MNVAADVHSLEHTKDVRDILLRANLGNFFVDTCVFDTCCECMLLNALVKVVLCSGRTCTDPCLLLIGVVSCCTSGVNGGRERR